MSCGCFRNIPEGGLCVPGWSWGWGPPLHRLQQACSAWWCCSVTS